MVFTCVLRAADQPGQFTEYFLGTATAHPFGITVGPDGALWFTESCCIGRITTAGSLRHYSLQNAFTTPFGIASGADVSLWFTDSDGGKVGKLATNGLATAYPLPALDSHPTGIVSGPDGALWFTELVGGQNKIGRITTAGQITEFPVPASTNNGYRSVNSIAVGPDGALWFADNTKVGRITIQGSIIEYPVPITAYAIESGSPGSLWFGVDHFARITTSGDVTNFGPVGPSPTAINGMAPGPQSAILFTDAFARIGRITSAGEIGEYPAPNYYPWGITNGPDGAIWFVDNAGGKVVRLVPPASQSIQFPTIPDIPYQNFPLHTFASSTSGLPLAYAANAPSVCVPLNDTILLTGIGVCSITATQAGGSGFSSRFARHPKFHGVEGIPDHQFRARCIACLWATRPKPPTRPRQQAWR